MFFWVKLALTIALVVSSAEVSKYSPRAAALLNALPLQSLIVLVWLYTDTHDLGKVNELSRSMLWVLPVTFIFFVCLATFTKLWGQMWPSLAAATVISGAVFVALHLARRFCA